MSQIDPIVLGHNPFFGVDHLSKGRGAQREARFADTAAILDMVRFAVDRGVGGLMMSTHPRANLVAEALRAEPQLAQAVRLYPLLPYVAKYVQKSNQQGLTGVILDQLKGSSLGEKAGLLLRGGISLLRKNVLDMLRALIQVEMAPFRGLQLRAVFLHNVLTDLALGLDMPGIFEFYIQEITDQFGALPAFATMNLPLLVERFRRYGLPRPLVMAHLNKVGFGVNPSREAAERCLADSDVQVMAMGTLASGYLRPQEAYAYVCRLPHVESIVVGVSTPQHAEETFAAIRRNFAAAAGAAPPPGQDPKDPPTR
jgi:hypothetical protein